MRLRALAPAKVNLCLFLGGLRGDGRHELVTLFESLSLADKVTLSVLSSHGAHDEVVCPDVKGPNIVSRALEGLRARGWEAPAVRVTVDKRVPIAAGMGGGSADAAAILRIANRLLPVPDQVIAELATELGADVPSQLTPGLVLGTGAGEQVQHRAPIATHAFVILPQPHRLSTAEVYLEADRLGLPRPRTELAGRLQQLEAELSAGHRPPAQLLVNDLERAALSLCPPIAIALDSAHDLGADHAFVCGSGPTVAGLYWGPDAPDRATAAAATLGKRFPGAKSAIPALAEFGSPLFA